MAARKKVETPLVPAKAQTKETANKAEVEATVIIPVEKLRDVRFIDQNGNHYALEDYQFGDVYILRSVAKGA